MKKIWILLSCLMCCLFFSPITLAKPKVIKTTRQRTPIPVKVSVTNQYWVETISICNSTSNPIPLNDIELDFNYAETMPTNIWGSPWAAWHIGSQNGQSVVLLGGTPYTPALPPDPNCQNPLTIQFNASPDLPAPTGPFVFMAAGATPPDGIGSLSINLPSAPETGLSNPQITISGMGQTVNKTVAWDGNWKVTNLAAGNYTVTSSTVTNGTHTYQANPINVTVVSNQTSNVTLTYTVITPSTGNMTITLPAAPEAGLNNPALTVTGAGQTLNQTVAWGAQWKLTNLASGTYTVTSSTVSNGTHTYQASPVSGTVNANATTQIAMKYTIVAPTTGNMTISVPVAPEAGLSNPQLTVEGEGQTLKQTVAWGNDWKLTNLAVGTYKVTSTTVSNSTHTYQATPISVTINANSTAQITMQYAIVAPNTGNITVSVPTAPEAGLTNPQITVKGMGQTLNQTVTWDNQWPLTNLAVGDYTITSSTVSNGTHTYQANLVSATVTANSTTQVSLVYSQVSNGRPTSWNNIKHVVIVVFENTNAGDAIKQPYFKSLSTKGAYLSQYAAIGHPSQPNYIALIGGGTFGVTNDSVHNINAKHLGDLIDAKGLTWKTYAEAYPGNCFQGSSSGTYYRKHEPFISFVNVQSNPTQCAKIVPGPQFFTDLAADKLPTYSFYVPDINNDGHDTGIAFADKYLSNTFGSILSNPAVMNNTLFIITFDEDDGSAANIIYTAFVGAAVKSGTTSAKHYTHYSTLKTIEDIFQLGSLGMNDQSATEISDIWMP